MLPQFTSVELEHFLVTVCSMSCGLTKSLNKLGEEDGDNRKKIFAYLFSPFLLDALPALLLQHVTAGGVAQAGGRTTHPMALLVPLSELVLQAQPPSSSTALTLLRCALAAAEHGHGAVAAAYFEWLMKQQALVQRCTGSAGARSESSELACSICTLLIHGGGAGSSSGSSSAGNISDLASLLCCTGASNAVNALPAAVPQVAAAANAAIAQAAAGGQQDICHSGIRFLSVLKGGQLDEAAAEQLVAATASGALSL